jgi:hypothetical protein
VSRKPSLRQAQQFDQMMLNWHYRADQTKDPETNAVAAKQALAAAYWWHLYGDEVAAEQAMDYADYHIGRYKTHRSRTVTWIQKHYADTAAMVGHSKTNPGKRPRRRTVRPAPGPTFECSQCGAPRPVGTRPCKNCGTYGNPGRKAPFGTLPPAPRSARFEEWAPRAVSVIGKRATVRVKGRTPAGMDGVFTVIGFGGAYGRELILRHSDGRVVCARPAEVHFVKKNPELVAVTYADKKHGDRSTEHYEHVFEGKRPNLAKDSRGNLVIERNGSRYSVKRDRNGDEWIYD